LHRVPPKGKSLAFLSSVVVLFQTEIYKKGCQQMPPLINDAPDKVFDIKMEELESLRQPISDGIEFIHMTYIPGHKIDIMIDDHHQRKGQMWSPGRSFSALDLFLNQLG
jgi:hypothetical protein